MSWLKDFILLGVLLGLLFFITLGSRPLASPDEARYSEIPREMLVSGDFITPHLNGIKYFEKPPFLYWVQSASLHSLGNNEWGARTPNAIFAIFTCFITYALGRFLYQRQTGIFAAIILGSSLLFFSMAHVVTLDMTLTFALTACLSSLLAALEMRKNKFFFYASYIFAALAILTKGLVGLLFPMGILFFWILFLNRWRTLKTLCLPTGLILMFALILPWHIAVQLKNPEFFHFYIIEQQFLRFFTLYAGRYQPAWFFIPIIFVGLFPWTIFLIQTLIRSAIDVIKDKQAHAKELFLLLWPSFIFIFFSLSKSKLIPYILPTLPPLAILISHYFEKARTQGVALGLIAFTTLTLLGTFWALKENVIPANLSPQLIILVVVIVIGSLLNAFMLFYKIRFSFVVLCLWAIAIDLTVAVSSLSIESTSVKPLIEQIKQRAKPEDIIVSYAHYYQDMPFYLQRNITLVNWTNELDFGMKHQNTDGLTMSEDILWQRWNEEKTIYIIMDERQYEKLRQQHTLYLIMKFGNDVVVTNRK